jgi:hypothetical protein
MPVGQFTGPGEVAALQRSIAADLENIRSSLKRCATAGTFAPDKTPGEWEAWQSMRARAEAFVSESPAWLSTVSQYERGELVQKELAGWHDKARALGCDAGPSPALPDPKTPLFSFAGISSTALLLLAVLLAWKRK